MSLMMRRVIKLVAAALAQKKHIADEMHAALKKAQIINISSMKTQTTKACHPWNTALAGELVRHATAKFGLALRWASRGR